MSRRIEIYDTTLRDGTQGEGFNLSLQDKLLITRKLDELGVDYVEGGFPLSNPKDAAYFQEVPGLKLKHAKVSAFGMTRRRGITADEDPGMKALLAAETPVVTLVGKSSEFQATKVLSVTPEENLKMIGDSVRFIRSAGRQVVYDAEHFFDAFKAKPDYAIRTLQAAQEAGASVLCLYVTPTAGACPSWSPRPSPRSKSNAAPASASTPTTTPGLPSPMPWQRFAPERAHVQGTINGVGERCGNMDLIPLIANLRLKYDLECLDGDSLQRLTDVSRYVYETANVNLVPGQPYVGSSAFAHKGGMHVHAVQKDASTYEHVAPESVGNSRKVLISEMSGQSNIAAKAGKKFDIEKDKAALKRVLNRVQDLENEGYQFEAAEASFELLLRKEIGQYRSFFDLDHYRVVVLRTNGGEAVSEATVKLRVNGKVEHCVAEGDGPVNALDGALRLALRPHFAAIDQVHLTDYKVRVINSKDETAAKVRVVIECRRDCAHAGETVKELFGTIGVSANVIDASWQAMVDAYEYHLLQGNEALE